VITAELWETNVLIILLIFGDVFVTGVESTVRRWHIYFLCVKSVVRVGLSAFRCGLLRLLY